MPRRGLDRARVVAAAGDIADAEGLEAVTLARVAQQLGVRSPSLYNHVAGRDGLLRALDPTRLAPGHGQVVEAPGAAMDRAIARGA